MKLASITANRHVFEGAVNGKPLRLLLSFEDGRSLCLSGAGDGQRMIADAAALDEPFDMGECGRIDVEDVTRSLHADLRQADIEEIRALCWHGARVGVKLIRRDGEPFQFWIDGDELHWGDEAALAQHDWLDGLAPTVGERIQF